MLAPIPLIGQSYQHRNLPVSAQTLKNWHVEINRESQAAISLQPWPGLTARLTNGGEDGGMHVFDGVLYKITENTLYSVDSLWNDTSVGTIDGSGLCSFISNANSMVVVRDGNVYEYDGSSLTKATDGDFENPDFVAYLNNQAVYDGTDGRFCISDPGDLTNINSLNYATAEKAGDRLVRPFSHNDRLLMAGLKTIEPWWNSGRGNPPVDPIQGSIIQKGLLAGHSMASNGRHVYFLGDDYIVHRVVGTQLERAVSTIPLAQTFRSYGKTSASQAVGHCLALDGQEFYYLHFPDKATWCYSEAADGWHQLTTGTEENPYGMTGYAEAYGKQLFSKGGNIYSLEPDVYENAGDTILRERISFLISAELMGKQYAGRKLEMNMLELVIKTVAPVTGQGSSPIVMVAYSDNNGRTWSNERQMQAAQSGNYTWRLRTQQLGQFYERLIRVRISDPIVSSILGASADIGLCIG